MKLKPYPKTPASYKSLPSTLWTNIEINDSMISSYRSNLLDRNTFPSSLHFHDYYEVVVILEGDIRYVCEDITMKPERGDVIVIPPGKFHMSMIAADETQYARHVFYLYPDVFSAYDCDGLLDFIHNFSGEQFYFSLSAANREKLLHLLAELHINSSRYSVEKHALVLANVLQIFYLFNQSAEIRLPADAYLPSSLMEIQRYIDEHFTEILSISDIASHFFYSREHVSRLFKKYFRVSVAEYVLRRRINYSCQLMRSETKLADICFQAGFSSVPAFIRSFKRVMGMTPSDYRKMLNDNVTAASDTMGEKADKQVAVKPYV